MFKKIITASLLLLIGFSLGVLWQNSTQDATADGFNNEILEVSRDAGGVNMRSGAGTQFNELETFLWGDRFLWLGTTSSDANGNEWLEVYAGNGLRGFVQNRAGALIQTDPLYTTPGFMPNAAIQVLPDGDAANIRTQPSTYSDLVHRTRTGERYTIIGGPYQAEFQIWWQVRTANGKEGWIIDIPNWLGLAR